MQRADGGALARPGVVVNRDDLSIIGALLAITALTAMILLLVLR